MLGSQGSRALGLCGGGGAVLRISAGVLLAEAPSLVAWELKLGARLQTNKGSLLRLLSSTFCCCSSLRSQLAPNLSSSHKNENLRPILQMESQGPERISDSRKVTQQVLAESHRTQVLRLLVLDSPLQLLPLFDWGKFFFSRQNQTSPNVEDRSPGSVRNDRVRVEKG